MLIHPFGQTMRQEVTRFLEGTGSFIFELQEAAW